MSPVSHPRRGFTIAEVAVVLAIMVVVLAIGWGSMRDSFPRYRLIHTAKALQTDLMHMRNLAIETNRQARLHLSGPGGDCATDSSLWGGGWELALGDSSRSSSSWDVLPVDAEDGSDDLAGEGTIDFGAGGDGSGREVCMSEWGSISGPGTNNEDAIVFDPRGWVANPGSDFAATGYIEITLVDQAGARKGVEDEIVVRISRAGLIRLESSLSPDGPASTASVGTGEASP